MHVGQSVPACNKMSVKDLLKSKRKVIALLTLVNRVYSQRLVVAAADKLVVLPVNASDGKSVST